MRNKNAPLPQEMEDLIMEGDVPNDEDVDDITIEEIDFDSTDESSDNDYDQHSNDNFLENAREEDILRDDSIHVYRSHITPQNSGNDYSNAYIPCCLSKNGELAVTGNENNIYVWDTTTGNTVLHLDDNNRFTSVEFNYNDEYLAVSNMSGIIRVWQISNTNCIWSINLHNTISWMQWYKSENILVTGTKKGKIHALKISNDERHKCLSLRYRKKHVVLTGIILPDEKRAAVGYEDGTIQVISLKERTVLSTTPSDETGSHGHSSEIVSIGCHMDNNLLISTSNKTILSSAQSGEIISILQDLGPNEEKIDEEGNVMYDTIFGYKVHLNSAAFCKDPSLPLAATGLIINTLPPTGKIFIWDILKRDVRYEINSRSGVSTLMWTNTSTLFTGGLDGVIRCFDARTGTYIKSFLGHNYPIVDLRISRCAEKILASSDDGTARIFQL